MSLKERALSAWSRVKEREKEKVLKKVAKIMRKWGVEKLSVAEVRKDEAVIEIEGEKVVLDFRHNWIYAELSNEIVYAEVRGLSLEALGSVLEKLISRRANKR